MDWKRAREQERVALKRLVALLFALADLAERACGRSRAIRGFVLWILRRAAAVAQDLFDDPPQASVLIHRGADTQSLAMHFRAMARKLDREAALAFAVHREEDEQPEPALLSQHVTRQAGNVVNIGYALVLPALISRPAPLRPP